MFKSQSLEELRQKISLQEVLSEFLELKRSGATYKALCPFHDEKTPSFIMRAGDQHFHCFGCGAHGDAIAFLMQHQNLSFADACEWLASRFHVKLETVEKGEKSQGPSRKKLRDLGDLAAQFFHYSLLHTKQGQSALQYLFDRGLDLPFIKRFFVGYGDENIFSLAKKEGYTAEELKAAGLLSSQNHFFFKGRVLFPIRDVVGSFIGFSGRKIDESQGGGKYINTPETPLFKKSRVLYGLYESRRRIAKEKRAIIVEGQIDALQLIQAGFDLTVAGQGTAFGVEQAAELIQLGVREVFLLLDGDEAGRSAAMKIGDLFQTEGVAAYVAHMPEGGDPDTLLKQGGPPVITDLIEHANDYITFCTRMLSLTYDPQSPEGKNALANQLSQQIRAWKSPILVHESLRRLAAILKVPEALIGIDEQPKKKVFIRYVDRLNGEGVDPDFNLEQELIRFLYFVVSSHDSARQLILKYLTTTHFLHPMTREIFETYLLHFKQSPPKDLLEIAAAQKTEEYQSFVTSLRPKKLVSEKAFEGTRDLVQKLLDREWMRQREAIRKQMESTQLSEDGLLELVQTFDALKRVVLGSDAVS